ncbi:MAG: NADH-quinone oxidoreductase subunit H [Candidatus Micrarchaeota archaeon]|nr:NADH-quinone oxidoreductase subunit H [Candidatus Micrarchaeota archaeon]
MDSLITTMGIKIASAIQGVLGIAQSAAINYGIAALLVGIAVMIIVTIFDYLFGWIERKLVAKIHLRHGPTRVGKYGLLQNAADFLKLFAKENIIPANANRLLFLGSLPIVAAIFALSAEVLPLTPSFYGVDLTLGLLIVFVLISFVPILIFIAGWASGNKFASISAQRSVMMLISYEIPLFIVIASVAMLAKSFSFISIVSAQSSLWYVALMPLGFVVFFIALLAELERPPFDLREADSELIAGWLTDVGAPLYAIALFIDYTRVFVGSMLIVLLFFGGWNGPYLPPSVWLAIKVLAVAIFVVIVRATTPRMRLDRILRLGWIWLVPLSIINLLWVFLLAIAVV